MRAVVVAARRSRTARPALCAGRIVKIRTPAVVVVASRSDGGLGRRAGTRRAGRDASSRAAARACGPGDSGAADTSTICSTPQIDQLVDEANQAGRTIARAGASRRASSRRARNVIVVPLGRQRHGQRRRHGIGRCDRARHRRGRTLPPAARRPRRSSDDESGRDGDARRPARKSDRGAHRRRGRRCSSSRNPAGRDSPTASRYSGGRGPCERRRLQLRRAADQVPHRCASSDSTAAARRQRRAQHAPPERTARRPSAMPIQPSTARDQRGAAEARAAPAAAATSAAPSAQTPTARHAT